MRNHRSTLFAWLSSSRNSIPTKFVRFSSSRNAIPTLFAQFPSRQRRLPAVKSDSWKPAQHPEIFPVLKLCYKTIFLGPGCLPAAQMTSANASIAKFSSSRNSIPTLFSKVVEQPELNSRRSSMPTLFARFSSSQDSVPTQFSKVVDQPELGTHAIC